MTTRTILNATVSAITGSTPKQMDGVAVEFDAMRFKAEAPSYREFVVPLNGGLGFLVQIGGGMYSGQGVVVLQNIGTVDLGVEWTPQSFTSLFSSQTTTNQKLVFKPESVSGDGGEIVIIANTNDGSDLRIKCPTAGTTEGRVAVWIGGK